VRTEPLRAIPDEDGNPLITFADPFADSDR
jgi:hypothetical protein